MRYSPKFAFHELNITIEGIVRLRVLSAIETLWRCAIIQREEKYSSYVYEWVDILPELVRLGNR